MREFIVIFLWLYHMRMKITQNTSLLSSILKHSGINWLYNLIILRNSFGQITLNTQICFQNLHSPPKIYKIFECTASKWAKS